MKGAIDSIEKYGKTMQVTCPKCGTFGQMTILRANNGLGLFGISVANYNHDVFCICNSCGALYGVKGTSGEKIGKAGSRRKTKELDVNDLEYQQTLPLK